MNFFFPAYYISSDFQVITRPIISKLFVKYGFNLSLKITLKSFEDTRYYFYLIWLFDCNGIRFYFYVIWLQFHFEANWK